jgi:hypothetical protein
MKQPNYDEQDFDNAEKLVKGRQFFVRKPQKSANLIAQLMARKGYGQQKSANEIDETWNAIAADAWREQTRIGTIRRGVLEIVVSTSVLNQRLEFDKKRLLTELNQRLPQIKLNDIRFRIGNI